MKVDKKGIEQLLRELPISSDEQVHTSVERVLARSQYEIREASSLRPKSRPSPATPKRLQSWWQRTPARAAAAVLAIALLSLPLLKTFLFPENVYAIVEAVDGPLYRVADGKRLVVAAGERIDVGTAVRTDDGAKAVLKLSDGALIEMHPESELSLEHTSDGTRIHLNDGIVNVKPAKQPTVSLYVQNREVTSPVTVGAEPEPRFEVASIRLVESLAQRLGQRGAAPGAESRPTAPADLPEGPRCLVPLDGVKLDPGRLIISHASLWSLIAVAYGNPCPLEKDLSGGDRWIQGELYDVEAIIPAGTPAYTNSDFVDGKAPKLQRMLQNLLADRFKLKLGREMKEFPAYNLVMIKEGKLRPYDPNRPPKPWPTPLSDHPTLMFSGLSMTQFASFLSQFMYRRVLDKTGAKGQFEIELHFPTSAEADWVREVRPTMSSVLEDQLGLKVESTRALVELLVIDHAERPSEN
jgi:uncharacterized protein (TIGR03435 family)